jgi:hypothetical protein
MMHDASSRLCSSTATPLTHNGKTGTISYIGNLTGRSVFGVNFNYCVQIRVFNLKNVLES